MTTENMHEAWDAQASWMRRVGATQAEWTHDGSLVSLTLDRATPLPSDDGAEQSDALHDPRPAREIPRSAGARLVRRAE